MSLKNVIAGINPPDDFYTIIEIAKDSLPIKYEVNKEFDALFVDRFLFTAMSYPENYGYIPQTLSDDGDPLDVLVFAPYPVLIGSVIRSRPVGIMYMEDEHGIDAKIIAVPHSKLSSLYDGVQSLDDLPSSSLARIQHFFEHYKDIEPEKWVKFRGWGDLAEAQQEIRKSVAAYQPHEDI